MFNPLVPNNTLPLLPGNFNYQKVGLYHQALQTQKELAKLNGLIHLLPNAEVLISPLITSESVSSSAIENIYTTTIDVLKSNALPSQLQVGAEKEVLHYRKAILHGYQSLKKNGIILIKDILDIQKIIEPNKVGIRSIPGTIIANTKGEAIYTPPVGRTVILDLLGNLEQFINDKSTNIEPLIKTGVIHFQFEAIHPFYDANGRTGRILMILYLLATEQLEYPILFLSGYIQKNKIEYYKILQYTQKTEDYSKIIIYILKAIHIQAKITANKIIAIQKLIIDLKQQIDKVLPKKSQEITRTLLKHPFITLQHFANEIGVSRHTARSYIQKLHQQGIIQKSEVGKYTLLSVPAFIQIISE